MHTCIDQGVLGRSLPVSISRSGAVAIDLPETPNAFPGCIEASISISVSLFMADINKYIGGVRMRPELLTVATALGLYAAVVVSPGPNFALISRLSIAGARPAAVGATFGLATAATLYAVLTMMGLALALTRIGWLAGLIQIGGGCYLVYLGIVAWLNTHPNAAVGERSSSPIGALRGLRMGLAVNLSNPKGIAFFIGLYAITVPPDTALWAKLMILAGGFTLEILWYGLVIILLSSRPARAAYERFGLWIERGIGTVLAAFGTRLISEKL